MARGSSYEEALAEAQRVGYAEADPSDDVSGRDAAAKMAILARLAFGAPVHIDDVPLRGHRPPARRRPRVRARARPGAEADRHGRAPPTGASRCACIRPSSTAGTRSPRSRARSTRSRSSPRRSPRSRCPGPGAGGLQTASAVLGDVVSVMTGGARPPAPPLRARLIEDVESAFYLHMEVADRPGVLASVAQVLGRARRLDQVGRAARHGRARAAGDGHPSAARVAPARGRRRGRAVRLRALAAARNPRDRRGVRVSDLPTVRASRTAARTCR